MNLVFVIDQYGNLNNGTTATARRIAQNLIDRGHVVKILAAHSNDFSHSVRSDKESSLKTDENKELIETLDIPFFQNIIDEQGFAIAKIAEESTYRQAFEKADLVHFFVPSPFCKAGVKVAKAMHIPVTAAFHVQPKNITYSLGMGKNKPANNSIYRVLKRYFYNEFAFIHCPSQMVANELLKRGYEADLRVISNGVADYFCPLSENECQENLILDEQYVHPKERKILLSVGRLSGEKRQDVLLNAIKYSKYKNQIYVVLAGQGPKKKSLKELACREKVNVQFGFYQQSKLRQLYNLCDLYIHPADAETEGISCMEAISCGAVPIIADSPYSATKEFALTDYSLFEAGNAKALAKRIDYWLDNPSKKAEYEQRYTLFGRNLTIDHVILEFEKFFQDAIAYQEVTSNRKRI